MNHGLVDRIRRLIGEDAGRQARHDFLDLLLSRQKNTNSFTLHTLQETYAKLL